jgi:hypothetical protein
MLVKRNQVEQLLKKKQLSMDEKNASACNTLEEFANFWADFSARTYDNFEQQHTHGWRLWVRRYQGFAKHAQTFMTDMKPVLEACSQISKPYTGWAFGTIATLFVASSLRSCDIITLALTCKVCGKQESYGATNCVRLGRNSRSSSWIQDATGMLRRRH